jgi:predicted O-linked N-acetylglucosamine transferase (SPINDLY family)
LATQKNAISPFTMLSLADNAALQLRFSRKWAAEKYTSTKHPLAARPRVKLERLRVGYFSADFHNHATLYLMAGLLREHDKSQFEVYAYSYGRSKSGEWRERAESDVGHFVDVSDLSAHAIADLARTHGLDIAIDLKGYTTNTRSDLFQHRLASIQINFLGYPGSMGADFIDYIVADPIVIPDDQRSHHSERVIYLPHSYQPNDNTREIAATTTTRADFGLPEDGFVFCCFNNSYKISPCEFDIWMRLLGKVKGSVLWLLRANRWCEHNLRQEAVSRGIAPERLVFADKAVHAQHLARHKHADLFVDTFNYNAHTTASDALWAGLPVVTKVGQQFAARVSASLLTAIGLPELITETEDAYEALILALATDPIRLSEIKAKLSVNRRVYPLFDTKRYTRYFEAGLHQAYDSYLAGQSPHDIWVCPPSATTNGTDLRL